MKGKNGAFISLEEVQRIIVYVNGQWMDDSTATVSFQDRAFVFADAVYEVVHIYNGAYFPGKKTIAFFQVIARRSSDN